MPTFPYTEYMVLGYSAAGVLFTAIVAYLIVRSRRLKHEIGTLQALESEDTSHEKQ